MGATASSSAVVWSAWTLAATSSDRCSPSQMPPRPAAASARMTASPASSAAVATRWYSATRPSQSTCAECRIGMRQLQIDRQKATTGQLAEPGRFVVHVQGGFERTDAFEESGRVDREVGGVGCEGRIDSRQCACVRCCLRQLLRRTAPEHGDGVAVARIRSAGASQSATASRISSWENVTPDPTATRPTCWPASSASSASASVHSVTDRSSLTVVVGPNVAAAASSVRWSSDSGRAACSTLSRRSGRCTPESSTASTVRSIASGRPRVRLTTTSISETSRWSTPPAWRSVTTSSWPRWPSANSWRRREPVHRVAFGVSRRVRHRVGQ